MPERLYQRASTVIFGAVLFAVLSALAGFVLALLPYALGPRTALTFGATYVALGLLARVLPSMVSRRLRLTSLSDLIFLSMGAMLVPGAGLWLLTGNLITVAAIQAGIIFVLAVGFDLWILRGDPNHRDRERRWFEELVRRYAHGRRAGQSNGSP